MSRSAKEGTIRRLIQGLYDYPRYSKFLQKELPPEIDKVANALARKYQWSIVPEGSTASHMLGLDLQVPARYVFLSSGPTKEYLIQGQKLVFIHRKNSHTMLKDHFSATLVSAIQSIGKGNLTHLQLHTLSSLQTAAKYKRIVRDTKSVTTWIHDEIIHIANIAEGKEGPSKSISPTFEVSELPY